MCVHVVCAAFLDKLQKGGDVNLIGQFGVGFYSIFLVADYVEVVSKNNADRQWLWESKADGNFAISEDAGEDLLRGTEIRIHLKVVTLPLSPPFHPLSAHRTRISAHCSF